MLCVIKVYGSNKNKVDNLKVKTLKLMIERINQWYVEYLQFDSFANLGRFWMFRGFTLWNSELVGKL